MLFNNSSKFFRYTLIAGLALSFVACKDEEDPEPRIGSISGATEGVSQVTAVNAGNAEYVATMGSNGRFSIGNLPAGDYTIKFTAAPGFEAPEEIAKVPVTGNVGTELGFIEAERNATFSYKVGGISVADKGAISVSISDDSTLFFSSDMIYVGGQYHRVQFVIEDFHGTGDYTLTANNDHLAGYTASPSSSGSGTTWQSDDNGTIKITSYNTEHRLITGTFTFTGENGFGTGVTTRTVTDGKFADLYIQE